MTNIGYHITERISRLLHLPELVALSGQQLLVLRYTLLHDDYLPYLRPRVAYRNIPALDADTEYLSKHFVPMDLQELLQLRSLRQPIEYPKVLLSFDGGLRHNLQLARMLEARQWPAVFFVPVESMDNRCIQKPELLSLILDRLNQYPTLQHEAIEAAEQMGTKRLAIRLQLPDMKQSQLMKIAMAIGLDIPTFLAEKKPYLSWEETRQLKKMGMDVGVLLTEEWTPEAMAAQMTEIEQNIGPTIRVAALGPYTLTPSSWQRQLLIRGEDPPLAALFGNRGLRTQRNMIHRLDMERHLTSARHQIKTAYLSAWVRRLAGMNRIKSRT